MFLQEPQSTWPRKLYSQNCVIKNFATHVLRCNDKIPIFFQISQTWRKYFHLSLINGNLDRVWILQIWLTNKVCVIVTVHSWVWFTAQILPTTSTSGNFWVDFLFDPKLVWKNWFTILSITFEWINTLKTHDSVDQLSMLVSFKVIIRVTFGWPETIQPRTSCMVSYSSQWEGRDRTLKPEHFVNCSLWRLFKIQIENHNLPNSVYVTLPTRCRRTGCSTQ